MSKEKTLSLAQALKYKNRLVQKMNEAKTKLLRSNVTLVKNEFKVKMPELYAQYCEYRDQLITLKATIQNANQLIYVNIFRLSELKAELQIFHSLDTKEGYIEDVHHFGQGEPLEYHSQWSEETIEEMITTLQDEVDNLQDKIDEFNHNTKITFTVK